MDKVYPAVYVAQPHNNGNYAQVFSTFGAAIAYVTLRTNRVPDSQTDDSFAAWYYVDKGVKSGETSWIVLRRHIDLEII